MSLKNYWHIKRRQVRKKLCSNFIQLDAFAFFRNKIDLRDHLDCQAYEIPSFDLKATLRASSLEIQYCGGAYNIEIEKQSCPFGGFRYFFRCPQCHKRMRMLYCIDGRFLCRQCHRLGYYTQRLNPVERCISMAKKIEERFQSRAGSLLVKPPWMKYKTFDKLQAQHASYKDERYIAAARKEFLKRYPDRTDEADLWF